LVCCVVGVFCYLFLGFLCFDIGWVSLKRLPFNWVAPARRDIALRIQRVRRAKRKRNDDSDRKIARRGKMPWGNSKIKVREAESKRRPLIKKLGRERKGEVIPPGQSVREKDEEN